MSNSVVSSVNVSYVITVKQGSEYFESIFSAEDIKDFIQELAVDNMGREALKEQVMLIFTSFRMNGDVRINVKDKILAFYYEVRKGLLETAESILNEVSGNVIRDAVTGDKLGYFSFEEVDGGTNIRVYGLNGWMTFEKTFTSWNDLLPLWGHVDVDVCIRHKKA